MKNEKYIKANPYDWPYNGDLRPENTALVVIDMQNDFCSPGGYVDKMGYDLANERAPIGPIDSLLKAMRPAGYTIIYTREGHPPDLSNAPANKVWRSKQMGAGIGDEGPLGRILVIGEKGQDVIPELYPVKGDIVIDKPGKGSFIGTDFGLILQTHGVQNIIFTGVTTDVCVHTTMRDANDMGYECLLVEDGTGATDNNNHLAALKMITMQGGVFGAHAPSAEILKVI
jgi:nicotinamidase-related amidase